MRNNQFGSTKWPKAVERALLIARILKKLGLTKGGYARRAVASLAPTLPIDEKTVVFDTFFGRTADCNPLAIFEEMIKRFAEGEYRYVWVRRTGVFMPAKLTNHPDVVYVEYGSVEWHLELARAKYIVFNSTLPKSLAPRENQVLVSTWHGIPIKKMGLRSGQKLGSLINTQRSYNLANIHLSSGEFYDEAIFDSIMAPVDRETIHHIGFPRLDVLAHARDDQTRIGNAKPVLLYAPTWRGTLKTVNKEVGDQIRTCRELVTNLGDQYEIYANLHYFVTNKIDIESLGVRSVPKDVEINVFLTEVDVLVSDYSSIAIDFVVLDRPVILYTYDLEEYRETRGFALDIDALPFQIAMSEAELLEAARAPKKPSEFLSFAKQSEKLLGTVDSAASSRTVDLMLNYVRQPQRSDKKRVLIYPGSFKPNGITSSFINLTQNLDYDDIDLFVIAHLNHIDRHATYRDQFERIDPQAKVLLYQATRLPRAERHSLKRKAPPANARSREAMFNRIANQFSIVHESMWPGLAFDAAVDFSGYSPFGSMLIITANAPRKSIFLHNDIAAEIRTRNNLSWVITEGYRHFDSIASVSPALMERNRESFAAITPRHLHTFCRNTLGKNLARDDAMPPCDWADHMRERRNQHPGAKIYINIARISPEKNHRRLLDAFAILKSQQSNVFLYVLGDGPDLEEIIEYSKQLNLQDQAFFAGWVTNPASALKEADAFVLSSNYEGQPMVLLESMALGTRCVAVENDATNYVLADGKGILTQATPEDLARGMREVISPDFTAPAFHQREYNSECVAEFNKVVFG